MPNLIAHSPQGQFNIRLFSNRAPVTCAYFETLARGGDLATCSVFRILNASNQAADEACPIHVMQMGPTGELEGPRAQIEHEDTRATGLTHCKWTVSAARYDLGEVYGSFFICMRDEPELDWGGCRQPDGQGFAAFGEVVAGHEILDAWYAQAGPREMLDQRISVGPIEWQNQ